VDATGNVLGFVRRFGSSLVRIVRVVPIAQNFGSVAR
jgi:hypothetical protein